MKEQLNKGVGLSFGVACGGWRLGEQGMSGKLYMSDGRRRKTCLLSWGSLYICAGCKSIIDTILMMGKAQKRGYKACYSPKK
jgi:hypothetical protein